MSHLSHQNQQHYNLNNININTIPSEFDGYFFPQCITNIVTRIKLKQNIMLTGPTGCGKTELVFTLAKMFNKQIVRVNFSVGTSESHLIGKYIVANNSTKFIYGVVPTAMKNGWWLLFDEIDYAQPEHLAVLQPVLEGDPLIITQNENEIIMPHPDFRLFATANTKGRGDETSGYVGTNVLNMSFLDRWSIIEIEYTSKEKKILKRMISDNVLVDQLIKFAKIIRAAVQRNELVNVSFSTRRLIQIAQVLLEGESLREALEYEFFSRYDSEKEVLKEIAYDIWDREIYFARPWKIGDSHDIKLEDNKENNKNNSEENIYDNENIE